MRDNGERATYDRISRSMSVGSATWGEDDDACTSSVAVFSWEWQEEEQEEEEEEEGGE